MTGAIPLSILFFLGALAAIVLSLRIYRDRSLLTLELLGLALSASVWSLFYGLEILAESEFYRTLWSQWSCFGAFGSVAFLIRFAVRWLRPRKQGWWLHLVWLMPLALIVTAFTNGVHGLFWTHVRPSQVAPYIWDYGHGPFFWVGVAYQYTGLLVVLGLVIGAARTHRGVYRSQAFYVLAGVGVGIIANALYVFDILNIGIDITPVAMSISIGIIYEAVSRGRLMNLLPAARHHVVDLMPDGLFILDQDFRIMDWNEAALGLWDLRHRDPVGTPIAEVVPAWEQDVAPGLSDSETDGLRTTLQHRSDEHGTALVEVEAVPLTIGVGPSTGWIVIFRDESDVRLAERELQQANERLEALNRMLLAQAIHDSLTGLFNRAYLDEALPRELARCSRDGSNIALIILDIDHFKNINDTHGHDSGDRVLKDVARLVKGIVRAGDIPCRFGGDEIVAVMPGASEDEATSVAERIRERVNAAEFGEDNHRLHVTVSVGVAVYPVHAGSSAELFRAADRALYAAKDAGRNRALSALA